MVSIIELKTFKKSFWKNLVTRKSLSEDNICFGGENAELDNRVYDSNDNQYSEKIKLLRDRIKSFQPVHVEISISRYNFFKLHLIAQCYLNYFEDSKTKLPEITFSPYPLSDIMNSFNKYIKMLVSFLPKHFTLELYDSKLEAMLLEFQRLAVKNDIDEDNLIRLLGVICEHAFIGPQQIVIDPHHRCNANCSHCWVHTPNVTHTKEFLNMTFPMERYKEIIDDASELKVGTIVLQGDGEPLLHPDSLEMLRYARAKGLGVKFFTNGILLGEKAASTVVEIGVNEIYCSVPAGTPETYHLINSKQPPDTYNEVVNNIRRLMRIKKESGKTNPYVIATHVIHTQNYHELVKIAQDDVYEDVDAARFYLIRLDVMNSFLQLQPNEIDKIKKQIPIVKKILKKGNVTFIDNIKFQLANYCNRDGSWSKNIFLQQGCIVGWYYNLIPAKGDISFCCHLRTVGDLTKERFKDIWTSPRYEKWRIQGKHFKKNKNAMFLNNQPLFDEHCTHCDNHQIILEVYSDLERFNLKKYY
ncbi:MAG: radical SAM protein [Deltaproteobacteria bacterium]|nr:radical SAM protein [Deltaproteobacteria bacterium]